MEEKPKEKEEELCLCHYCEKEVKKEDFDENAGMCHKCIDYNDYAYEMMRDLEIERHQEAELPESIEAERQENFCN